jgi:hypothetical protein
MSSISSASQTTRHLSNDAAENKSSDNTTYAPNRPTNEGGELIARRPCKLGSHTPCITNSVGSNVGTIYNGYPSDKWIESALSALNKDLQEVNSIVDPVYVDNNRTAVIKTSDDYQRIYLEVKNNQVAGVKVDTFPYKIPLEYYQNTDTYGRMFAN